MRVLEEHHNDTEQVENYLGGALALVKELDPPEDLREVFFGKAIDLLSAKTVQYAVPQHSPLAIPGRH